ncbi:MAG TPA: M50 family metallopeptidase [Puia sp.]|nr:M50 family metallopeptidase [Puia sp.]
MISLVVLGTLITLLVLAIIVRIFTVLFHELGHAFAALLLTGGKVTIYVGSYGDPATTSRDIRMSIDGVTAR